MDDLDEDRFSPLTESELAAIPVFDAGRPKKIVADRFDYHDETGALLYQVERIEFQNPDGSFVLADTGKRKKTFPQRRPDSNRPGEWVNGIDGVRRVPYRLPELIEAVINDSLIVVAEGERKVDLLRSWGFAATCNSGGSGSSKIWIEHARDYFSPGANVVIVPDKDEPGRDHANTAAAALKEAGATVRVLDLPGLGPKGDVIDWAQAGGTAERLHDLIEHDAKPWVPREANGHDTWERFLPPGARRPHSQGQTLPAPPDRDRLILSAWINRDIPDRDYLLGNVMCTTSRWFVIGETGIGKTLFGGTMGGAAAKGASFLNWEARRPSRVMYLDGELPVETFKERMELIAARYGAGLQFYGYNREDLGFDGMPPLNTPTGQAWLRREIEAINPDLILFDSIMCLLVGSMLDEATWAPMKPLVCELSARHIAQVWFNHANDLGKSFGDKTREWEMDTVAKLSKVEGDETAIRLDFIKARLRTPKTAGQFAPLIIRPSDNWRFEIAKNASGGKSGSDVEIVRDELLKAYDQLADGAQKSFGLDDRSTVLKVSAEAVRDELKDRGFLDTDEKGAIERVSRGHFFRAKKSLLKRGTLIEKKGQIWRP